MNTVQVLGKFPSPLGNQFFNPIFETTDIY